MSSPSAHTVLGLVAPEDLGVTFTDEHLSCNNDLFFTKPHKSEMHLINCEWSLQNRGWIHQWPYSHKDNLNLTDAAGELAMTESLKIFKAAGGGCLVENSTYGMNRNTKFLKTLSQDTGVHIIAGTGYYVAAYQKQRFLNTATIESLTKHMIDDLTNGTVECPEIKCGFIGEIGSDYPMKDFERNCIQASGLAQESTGAPVGFHPGRHVDAPFEIMRIFAEAGGNPEKACVGHIERTLSNPDLLLEFADEFNCYNQFDLFGTENSYYQFQQSLDFPNDATRMVLINCLINGGFDDRILVSHDIHTKHRLEKYGGHGFKHIIKVAVPKMLSKGITQEQIDKILKINPANFLCY